MNHQDLFVTAAIAASVALSAPAVNAGPINSPEARAFAAAQESPASLRHFVDRTRMIYALNFNDYYRPDDQDADADVTADSQSTEAEAPEPGAVTVASATREQELEEFRAQIYRDMLLYE